MKRLFLVSTLVLCLLLCGCGAAKTPAPTPEPAPTPVPTEVLTPDEGLLTLLGEVRDRMHIGTAGSSLRAASLAAELLDWAAESTLSPAALRLTVEAYLGSLDEAERAEFLEQLQAVDGTAARLATPGDQAEALLSDAGCKPAHYPWPQEALDREAQLMQIAGAR